MGKKIVLGLVWLCALVEGVASGVVPNDLLPLALVVLGVAWGYMSVDASDPTVYCAVAVAVGLTGYADALNHLPVVGMYLDGIIDNLSIALYSGVAAVVVNRSIGILTEE